MTDLYQFWGVLLGLVMVIVYIGVRIWRAHLPPDLAEAVRLFFASYGIVIGIKICLFAMDPLKLAGIGDSERIYIFLGGVAAVWVCVQTILHVFRLAIPHTRTRT